MARGTGTTTQQLTAAPIGAIYICNAGELHHTIKLARHIGREDLQIKSISWIELERFRGLRLTGIVIDHNTIMTDNQCIAFTKALSEIKLYLAVRKGDEDEKHEREQWRLLDYDNGCSGCTKCGRFRLCLCPNGKHRCEKCNWSPELNQYISVDI